MPNRLELPEDLGSLIEKREQEDRRATGAEKPEPGKRTSQPATDRRSGEDRRNSESDTPPTL